MLDAEHIEDMFFEQGVELAAMLVDTDEAAARACLAHDAHRFVARAHAELEAECGQISWRFAGPRALSLMSACSKMLEGVASWGADESRAVDQAMQAAEETARTAKEAERQRAESVRRQQEMLEQRQQAKRSFAQMGGSSSNAGDRCVCNVCNKRLKTPAGARAR